MSEPTVVPTVDLPRYLGSWYEIARFPNRFQSINSKNVVAQYTQKPGDKNITVHNACYLTDKQKESSVTGEARIPDPNVPGKLEVRFAPKFLSWLSVVWGEYWIYHLGGAEDVSSGEPYTYSVVGDSKLNYLWILAREKGFEKTPEYQECLEVAKEKGFDVSKLILSPHDPDSTLPADSSP